MKRRIALLTAAVLLCLGGGFFLYHTGFFAAATSTEGLRSYIDRFAPYSHLCFFLVQFLSVVLAPIPSNITSVAGGVLFGTWPSFFLTYAAVISGSLLVFSLARGLGRDFAWRDFIEFDQLQLALPDAFEPEERPCSCGVEGGDPQWQDPPSSPPKQLCS